MSGERGDSTKVSDVDLEAGLGKCLGGPITDNTYYAQDNNSANGDPSMDQISHEVENELKIFIFLTGLSIVVLIPATGFKLFKKGIPVFMWATIGSSYVGTPLGLFAITASNFVNDHGIANLKWAKILNYIITVHLVLSISSYPMAATM